MDNNGQIYIVITDKRPSDVPGTPGPGGRGDDSSTGDNNGLGMDAFSSYMVHQFINFTKQQVTKAINYEISHIGSFQGDYQSQRTIQTTMQDLSTLVSIGGGALAGFKVGGVPGAIIGAVIATSSLLINRDYANRELYIKTMQNNFQIEQLRNRAGLNQLTNGSRGTLD